MMDNIILIDDSKIDLFINKKVIEKYNAKLKIKAFTSAFSAIDYLKIKSNFLSIPDIIFLDINMPQMNGFQFLKKLEELELVKIKTIEIFILSSSLYSEDLNKAKKEKLCSGYINKPLTVSKIEKVLALNHSKIKNDNIT